MGEFRDRAIAHHQYHQHYQRLPDLCCGWQTTQAFQIAQRPEISAFYRKGLPVPYMTPAHYAAMVAQTQLRTCSKRILPYCTLWVQASGGPPRFRSLL